jgi:hypothetical protein
VSDHHRPQEVGRARRRHRAWTAGVAIAVTVAVSVPALGMTGGAPTPAAATAAACPSVTVPGFGPDAPDQRLAVKLIGSVTCGKARRLVRGYFRRVADGDCAGGGNRCIIGFPGGWVCSFIPSGESQLIGGAVAGCAKGPLRAAIRLFPAGTRPGKLDLFEFRAPNLKVSCALAVIEAVCGARTRDRGPTQLGAAVDPRGQVSMCGGPSPRKVCVFEWRTSIPIVAGQQTEANGVRCTAIRDGIRCVRTRGPGAGNGFFVSATTARRIGPARTSAADSRAASTTVSGTLLSVQNELQILTQSDGTRCGVVGGTLRTATGDVDFGAGGVLTAAGTLDPGTQAIVDTLHGAERLGSAAVTTITIAVSTICGYPGNVVTAASVAVTPTPPPSPPQASIPPPAAPQPITQTASGIVTRMSPVGLLINGASKCEIWPGVLKTDAGPSVRFAVQTPLTGSFDTGLVPADPTAVTRAKMLQQGAFFKAPVTMTYTGPVRPCGYPLDAVVMDATVDFASPYETKPKITKRGRITRMSAPSVVSGYGSSCRLWRGSLTTTTGVRWSFAVETELAGSPAHAVDRRAVKLARLLRRAKGGRAVTTITFAGPVIACGQTLPRAVTRASTTRRNPR